MGNSLSFHDSKTDVKNSIKTALNNIMQSYHSAITDSTNTVSITTEGCTFYKPVTQKITQITNGQLTATFKNFQNATTDSSLAAAIAEEIAQSTSGQVLGNSANIDVASTFLSDSNELVENLKSQSSGSCIEDSMNSANLNCKDSTYYDTFDGTYEQFISFKLDCIFHDSSVMKSVQNMAAKLDEKISQTTKYNDLGDILATLLMVVGVAVLIFFSPEIMASSAVEKAWSDPIGKILVLAIVFGLWTLYLSADCGGAFPWFHIPFLKWGVPPSICSPATKYPLYIGTGALAVGTIYLAFMTPKIGDA